MEIYGVYIYIYNILFGGPGLGLSIKGYPHGFNILHKLGDITICAMVKTWYMGHGPSIIIIMIIIIIRNSEQCSTSLLMD